MTNRGLTGEEYLDIYWPDAARWINTCLACKRKGYRPDLPEVIIRRHTDTALAQNLRSYFEPLEVNAEGLCRQCAEISEGPK